MQTSFNAWRNYHISHPEVFYLFLGYARQAHDAGGKRIGARLIGERIRWFANVERRGDDDWLINDHYWPYYARLAMLVDDRLQGIFSRRDTKFDATDEEILEVHTDTLCHFT
jgi:hypothetical protein